MKLEHIGNMLWEVVMRKVLGLLLWIGACAFGFLCMVSISSTSSDNEEMMRISYAVGMAVSYLASGIGRRIFHIKQEVVDNKGLGAAIVSRINCKRFYLSIIMYAALAYTLFVMLTDGEMVYWVVGALVFLLFFYFVRRTCPSCGHGLTYDDAQYGDKAEWSQEGDNIVAKRDYTKFYHCPRCGRKMSFTKKRETARI